MDLQALRDSTLSKADEQGTGYISNAELDRFINQGYRMIYGKIVQRFEDYFITRGTLANGGLISVTNGVDAYPLPSGILKLIAVEHHAPGAIREDGWTAMKRVDFSQPAAAGLWPAHLFGGGVPFGYYVEGSNLVIRPVPSSGFSVRIKYVPVPADLVAPTDVPVVGPEYHDLISEFAAIQCLRKSGEGIFGESMQVFNMELQNLMETVETRDVTPDRIRITQPEDY